LGFLKNVGAFVKNVGEKTKKEGEKIRKGGKANFLDIVYYSSI